MPAFVMRGLAQLGARVPQSVERPFHVALISGSVLDQRNNRERCDEDLTGEFGFHTGFGRHLRMRREFALGKKIESRKPTTQVFANQARPRETLSLTT
jgi:hypothetical protein